MRMKRPLPSMMELLRRPGQHLDVLGWLAAIGVVVVGIGGGFAYVSGVLTPHRLTAQRMINTLRRTAAFIRDIAATMRRASASRAISRATEAPRTSPARRCSGPDARP
jgi:hypothetical protein